MGSENGQFREGISVTNTSHGLTLFIENVWVNDTDTYECIVWNNNALPSIQQSMKSFHLQVIGESSKCLSSIGKGVSDALNYLMIIVAMSWLLRSLRWEKERKRERREKER